MPDDKRRTLLILLAGVVVLSLLAVTVSLELERLGAARSRVALLQKQIEMLVQSLPSEAALVSRRDELGSRLELVKDRFYRAEEMSPYAFGTLVKDKLATLGMSIARYQVLDTKGRTALEFVASGPATAFATFLRDTFASGKYWAMPSMTIRTHDGTGVVDVVFQVGYEELGRENP